MTDLKFWSSILLFLQAIVTGTLWFRFPILLVSFFIILCMYAIDANAEFDQEWIAGGLAVWILTYLFAIFAIGG
ncbi:MAG: hypothetical protein ABSF09_04930 [Candidatus Bathyarchaeia archaeon]